MCAMYSLAVLVRSPRIGIREPTNGFSTGTGRARLMNHPVHCVQRSSLPSPHRPLRAQIRDGILCTATPFNRGTARALLTASNQFVLILFALSLPLTMWQCLREYMHKYVHVRSTTRVGRQLVGCNGSPRPHVISDVQYCIVSWIDNCALL